MPLTKAEQRKILRALPASKKAELKRCCHASRHYNGVQSGTGIFGDAFNWLKKTLGPIAKEIAPVVLKEFVMPMLKKKVGLGLSTAGSGLRRAGSGLSTAGSGVRTAGSGVRTAGSGLRRAGAGKKKKNE